MRPRAAGLVLALTSGCGVSLPPAAGPTTAPASSPQVSIPNRRRSLCSLLLVPSSFPAHLDQAHVCRSAIGQRYLQGLQSRVDCGNPPARKTERPGHWPRGLLCVSLRARRATMVECGA